MCVWLFACSLFGQLMPCFGGGDESTFLVDCEKFPADLDEQLDEDQIYYWQILFGIRHAASRLGDAVPCSVIPSPSSRGSSLKMTEYHPAAFRRVRDMYPLSTEGLLGRQSHSNGIIHAFFPPFGLRRVFGRVEPSSARNPEAKNGLWKEWIFIFEIANRKIAIQNSAK